MVKTTSIKTFTFIVISILFLTIACSTFAQENPQTTIQQRNSNVKEKISDRIIANKEEATQRRAAAKASFMEKVEQITDEQKSQAVERINNALITINDTKTQRWAEALDRFSDILDRIKTKAQSLDESGADTTDLTSLIQSAETAINSATTTVDSQSQKDYVIEIEDEATLRESIQPVVQQLKEDLKTTLGVVKTAKTSLHEAARVVATLDKSQQNSRESLDLNP